MGNVHLRSARLARLGVLLALAVGGCGSDSGKGDDDDTMDSGVGSDGTDGKDGTDGNDGTNGMDSGTEPDGGGGGGGNDAGNPNSFMIPAGGGTTTVQGASGNTISFTFPASAAGVEVTLTPSDAASIGWDQAKFTDVIKLEPDGQQFADPVEVSVSNGALLVLDFPSDASQSAPDPLALSGDGDALLLTHFSTLAVVAPGQSCQSTSGWNDQADSQLCANAGGGATTYRSYGCKNYQFCYLIEAHCCVAPDDPDVDCRLGDEQLVLNYTRTDSNGGEYPYCDQAQDADAGTDGGDSCAGQAPYVSSYAPTNLVANSTDQTLTLYGTCFGQGGTIFYGYDVSVSTTWVSATEAHATIAGSLLGAAGTLSAVGYVNASGQGGYDWVNRSNMVDVSIAQ